MFRASLSRHKTTVAHRVSVPHSRKYITKRPSPFLPLASKSNAGGEHASSADEARLMRTEITYLNKRIEMLTEVINSIGSWPDRGEYTCVAPELQQQKRLVSTDVLISDAAERGLILRRFLKPDTAIFIPRNSKDRGSTVDNIRLLAKINDCLAQAIGRPSTPAIIKDIHYTKRGDLELFVNQKLPGMPALLVEKHAPLIKKVLCEAGDTAVCGVYVYKVPVAFWAYGLDFRRWRNVEELDRALSRDNPEIFLVDSSSWAFDPEALGKFGRSGQPPEQGYVHIKARANLLGRRKILRDGIFLEGVRYNIEPKWLGDLEISRYNEIINFTWGN